MGSERFPEPGCNAAISGDYLVVNVAQQVLAAPETVSRDVNDLPTWVDQGTFRAKKKPDLTTVQNRLRGQKSPDANRNLLNNNEFWLRQPFGGPELLRQHDRYHGKPSRSSPPASVGCAQTRPGAVQNPASAS